VFHTNVVCAFGVIKCLTRSKLSSFQLKPPPKCIALQQCLQEAFGVELVRELDEVAWRGPRGDFQVHGFLPSPGAWRKLAVRSSSERTFLYVNRRPVDFPLLTRLLWKIYRQHIEVQRKHYAFVYLELVFPLSKVDGRHSSSECGVGVISRAVCCLSRLEQFALTPSF
jgi:DNA mismatch repair ATPase MutL